MLACPVNFRWTLQLLSYFVCRDMIVLNFNVDVCQGTADTTKWEVW